MAILAGPQAYYHATYEIPSTETAYEKQQEIQKRLEKLGRNFTKSIKRDRPQHVPIEQQFKELVETSLVTVRNEDRGTFGRLCAVTTAHELYNGARQHPKHRIDHSAAVYRVLQCGAKFSAQFDQQIVDQDIVTAIFTGIRDGQNPLDVYDHFDKYIEDPFLSDVENEV